MNNENAKITSTFLGYEDHGIFTFSIGLEGDGWGVGFGGIALDGYDIKKDERVPDSKAVSVLTEILKVVGVNKWEDLKGKTVRVENNGLGRPVKKIGNLIKNDWLDLEEYFKD